MEELFESIDTWDIPDKLLFNHNNEVQVGDSEIENNSVSRYFENARNLGSHGFPPEMWSNPLQTTAGYPKPIPTLENYPGDTDSSFCQVCSGQATGRYYGVHACDSCRAFFRRTMFYKDTLTCEREGSCDISLNSKARCRSCRYQRCMKMGMKAPLKLRGPETTEFPKSKKSRLTLTSVDDGLILRTTQTLCMSSILEVFYASSTFAQNSAMVHELEPQTDPRNLSYLIAHHTTLHAQLLWMVEWAKRIPGFRDLVFEDQITLLRSACGKHVLIQSLWETASCCENYENPLISLGWGKLKVFLKNAEEGEKSGGTDGKDNNGIQTQNLNFPLSFAYLKGMYSPHLAAFRSLLKSFMELEVTEVELTCLEALFLLDPNTKGLYDRKKVLNIRKNVQSMVMGEARLNLDLPSRLMDIYQLLPEMDCLSRLTVITFRDSGYFDAVGKISKLVDDLYLGSIEKSEMLNLSQFTHLYNLKPTKSTYPSRGIDTGAQNYNNGKYDISQ